MSLWRIAWRGIRQRALASSLTALSIALGVALVVTVLVIHQVVDQSFRRSAQGFDLVVGAKAGGGPLDLVLSTVYHLDRPTGNIPYRYYREFVDGRFASEVETAIPICKGDNFQGFPVIGTVPEMFTELKYLEGRTYEFAAGRNFKSGSEDEAVFGAAVARQSGLGVGDEFRSTHGIGTHGGPAMEHPPMKIVGVLAPTGTPADRAVYIDLESFYHLEGHEHATKPPADSGGSGHARDDHNHDDHAHAGHDRAEDEHAGREVTAVLVCTAPWRVQTLERAINESPLAQAAVPARVIGQLFEGLIGNVQTLLLIMAVMVVVVAGIGMLVSMYNSMNDRRREIAIMRALGARRGTVMSIILLESILLALGGGAAGMLLGHGLIAALAPMILDHTGVVVHAWQPQWQELVLVPGLIALAAVVGYLPAGVAYRTDVARSLSTAQ